MKTSDINPWPAFSDILFMLFLTTLIAAGVITHWAITSEERLRGCGAAESFMQGFSACLDAPFDESDAACKVAFGEERLRFEFGKDYLKRDSVAFGRQLATCLADQLILARENPKLFDSIEFIAIDGYTDCAGEDMENLGLGARRATTIYGYFFTDVVLRDLPQAERFDVLGKVAIRSFGKSRPLPESPCAKDPEDAHYASSPADRRVEIAINSRLLDR